MELRKKILLELNKSVETTRLNVTTLQPYEIVKSVISYGNLTTMKKKYYCNE